VNLQGVDDFGPEDPVAYANEHFVSPDFIKPAWVDDSSVNFIYKTSAAAKAALHAFTSNEIIDVGAVSPTTSRPAKPYSKKPDAQLVVRQANSGDQKSKDARKHSRWHLLNRGEDNVRSRRDDRGRGRYNRNGDNDAHYRPRHFDDAEIHRRQYESAFDDNMYDDVTSGAPSLMASHNGRRSSTTSMSLDEGSSRDGRRRRRRNDRYVGAGRRHNDRENGTSYGRLRDRSASPVRDGDGRYGFDEEGSAVSHRRRSRSPPRRSNNARRDDRPVEPPRELIPPKRELMPGTLRHELRDDEKHELFPSAKREPRLSEPPKELFPTTGKAAFFGTALVDEAPRELFGNNRKTDGPKELFGNKTSGPKELFGNGTSGPKELFGNKPGGPQELFGQSPTSPYHRRTDATDHTTQKRSLFDRITPRSPTRETGGRRNMDNGDGFNIRGAAEAVEQSGGELKIRGRGKPRMRAYDFED